MKINEENDQLTPIPPVDINTTESGKSNDLDLSIIPVNSNKCPFGKWKQYQSEIAPYKQWKEHFDNGGYVGIITGEVSGHLECIDIDVKNDPDKAIFADYHKIIPEDLASKLIIQRTPNEGYHFIYRCTDAVIDGNLKLAHSEQGEVILETRGEGGYFCHHLNDYSVRQGKMDFIQMNIDIPVITPEERDTLLTLARSLDRNAIAKQKEVKPHEYKEPAIVKFNEEYNIIELFKKHGWTVYAEDDQMVKLTRPGSSAAFSGYYYKDSKVYMCFSGSAGFKVKQPNNHFQVLKVLEGNGDNRKTESLLPQYGFEVKGKVRTNSISSDDIAAYLNEQGVQYDAFRQDIIKDGKIITEMTYNTLFIDLKKYFGKEVPRTRFEEVIKSNYINQFHPIKAFIEKHKDRHPLGTFEKWMDCIELKNKDIDKGIVLHFFKKWYVGIIAQALGGEFANEFFLCLLSTEQGIGKTTLLRKFILPEELRTYQTEHPIAFDEDFKVLMGQSLLIIDDEMDGRTFNAEKTFRNILSQSSFSTRRKYDRRISVIDRNCSFAGSGNQVHIIRDKGNRRIIPLELEMIHQKKLPQLDYIDLFMEAYHLYANDFKYSYEPTDRDLLDQITEDHMQQSDVDMVLDDYVEYPIKGVEPYYISTLDLVLILGREFPQFGKRINVPSLGKKMAERGFKTKRRGKKRVTCYAISPTSSLLELIENMNINNNDKTN
ncbi:VapE domain-containing protein [Carboxylicivirga sp. N1Y90]|uniref:VapE domain-containing protein n=1 Tax=Carboxylicivirga fragile TaxID=3417571 RepID=UPI003D3539D5|nr:hypothetical protein [Marinilabiliaceae bacterium N1Y90]